MRVALSVAFLLTVSLCVGCGGKDPATPAPNPQVNKEPVKDPAKAGKPEELFPGKWTLAAETPKEQRIQWPFLDPQPEGGVRIQTVRGFSTIGKSPEETPLMLMIGAEVKRGDRPGFFVGATVDFKFLDNETLELKHQVNTIGIAPPPPTFMKLKVKVTADELTLSDDKGHTEKYTRIKPVAAKVKVTGLPICCGECEEAVKKAFASAKDISNITVDLKEKSVSFTIADGEDSHSVYKGLEKAGMDGKTEINGKPLGTFSSVGQFIGTPPPPPKEITIKAVHACCGECQKLIADAVKGGKVTFEGDGPTKTVKITGDKLDRTAIQKALSEKGFRIGDWKETAGK